MGNIIGVDELIGKVRDDGGTKRDVRAKDSSCTVLVLTHVRQ